MYDQKPSTNKTPQLSFSPAALRKNKAIVEQVIVAIPPFPDKIVPADYLVYAILLELNKPVETRGRTFLLGYIESLVQIAIKERIKVFPTWEVFKLNLLNPDLPIPGIKRDQIKSNETSSLYICFDGIQLWDYLTSPQNLPGWGHPIRIAMINLLAANQEIIAPVFQPSPVFAHSYYNPLTALPMLPQLFSPLVPMLQPTIQLPIGSPSYVLCIAMLTDIAIGKPNSFSEVWAVYQLSLAGTIGMFSIQQILQFWANCNANLYTADKQRHIICSRDRTTNVFVLKFHAYVLQGILLLQPQHDNGRPWTPLEQLVFLQALTNARNKLQPTAPSFGSSSNFFKPDGISLEPPVSHVAPTSHLANFLKQ